MKRMLKKSLAFILALTMVFGAAPLAGLIGLELPKIGEIFAEKAEAATLTYSQLNAKFPDGKYWNHGSGGNNPDGYTSSPCSHAHGNCSYSGSCGCNSFNGIAIQCYGFALKLGYDYYGSNPKTDWGRAYNLDNLKPGDIVNYNGDGHTVFVIGVNGNDVTVAECNRDGHCRIDWGRHINKSGFNNLQNVYVAPYAMDTNPSTPTIEIAEGVYTFHNVRDMNKVIDIKYNSLDRGAPLLLFDNELTQTQKFRVVKNGDYYNIQSVYSGHWVDISMPEYGKDGCAIQLWDDNSNNEEKWVFEDAGNGNVYIHSPMFNVNIDSGGPTDNRTELVTYHPDGSTSQQWKLVRVNESPSIDIEEGIYEFHNARDLNQVMDIRDDSTEDFAVVQLYEDLNNKVQKFKVVKLGSYYGIQSLYSEKWLDISAPSIGEKHLTIQLFENNTNNEEKWVFEDAGNGYVTIRSLYDVYVDTESGRTENRTALKTFQYDGTTSQQWKLIKTTEKPTAVLEADETCCDNNTNVFFTFGGNNSGIFTLGIYKEGTRIDTVTVEGNSYHRIFSEPGNYSAYMTAYSSPDYADSNWVYWKVYDKTTAELNIDRENTIVGSPIEFTLGGDNCGRFTIGIYKNGERIKTETIESYSYSFTPTEPGDYSAYMTAFSKHIEYADSNWVYWTVSDPIINISIKDLPSKTNYFVGDTLDESGLELIIYHESGTTQTINSGFTCTPTTLNTAGTQTITVTYLGKTATFDVNVKNVAVSSIAVKSNPTKTSYYVGDTLDTSGLTLTATYNNGTTQIINSGFTCTPTTLNTAGTQTITVTYSGKTATFDVNVKNVAISSIAVKSNPTKTSYYVGDTLNTSGLTLTATYNNGTTQTINSGFTCTPTTLNTAGTQTITVTYSGKTATFDVNVKNVAVSSIAIKSNPTKTSYYVGDTLDTSGLTLTATYNNGTTQTINSGFTCTPTTLNTAGTQTITVTYSGKTTSFNVTVNTDVVKRVAVKSNPTKTSYYVGDTLNTSGLTLTATYNSGKTETVNSGFVCSPTTLNTAGTQTITVTYSGKTATFDVNVKNVAISSIAVKSNPTKTSYYVGDTLNASGLTLTATYNNGTTQTFNSGFTCTPTTLNTAGTQTITVTYSGKTTSFNVTVNTDVVKSVAVKSNPTKTSYYVGDTLNTSGLTLTATYNSGKTETINSGFVCTPTTLNTAGTQTITVTYSGKTAMFDVDVKNVAISSIAVKSNPTKTSYYVGDTLDTSGLTLTATYNNGTIKTINSGFSCSPTTLNTTGTQKITVTYSGKTAVFDVYVINVAISSIAIKSNPTKTSYYVGDTLDTSGLTLTATYNNGTTQTIDSGYTCTPTTLNTAGTQTIGVTYGGKTTSFNVVVLEVAISGISIFSVPDVLSYYVGDTLLTDGLAVLVTYNNGTNKIVTSGFTCTPMVLNTEGIQKVTVIFEGKTASFNVSVTSVKITEIEIVNVPEKTSYIIGEKFDPKGLTMKAVNNKGEEIVVTEGFICYPEILDKAGTQVVTISYGGKSVMITVIVDEVTPETYTVKFISNSEIILQAKYVVGETIVKPSNPTKDGYRFIGWTPEVPETMPAYDLTFTAVFEKIETPIENEIKVSIRNPSTTTINYGDAIILHADIDGTLPEGARIEWTADNGNFSLSVSADGTTCKISPKSSGKTVFTATAYDKDGNVISSDTQEMTAKAGLWQKIVVFFKKIFGLTKTIPEAFKGIL